MEQQDKLSNEHGEWQLCPKCNGQGNVSKPPYLNGDVYQWTAAEISFVCDVCHGLKVIARPLLNKEQEAKVCVASKAEATTEAGLQNPPPEFIYIPVDPLEERPPEGEDLFIVGKDGSKSLAHLRNGGDRFSFNHGKYFILFTQAGWLKKVPLSSLISKVDGLTIEEWKERAIYWQNEAWKQNSDSIKYFIEAQELKDNKTPLISKGGAEDLEQRALDILDKYEPNREYPQYYHESDVTAAMIEMYNAALTQKAGDGWKEALEHSAEKYADSLSFKSDKLVHETTAWTEWNNYNESFKRGAEWAKQFIGKQ